MDSSDRTVVDQITRGAAGENYRFAAVVTGIVNSQAFRMRRRAE